MTETARKKRRWVPAAGVAALLALFFGLPGCMSEQARRQELDKEVGQLTLYLNGPDKASVDITFELEMASIVMKDGSERVVMSEPRSVNSLSLKAGQMLLGEEFLPKGEYTELSLLISDAKVAGGKEMHLGLPEDRKIRVPIRFDIRQGENTTIFLTWNADASLAEGFRFELAMTAREEGADLVSLLVFVSNEGSGNVSLINRQTDKVVASVLTGKEPRGIAAGRLPNRLRVYVANRGSNSVSVIDPSTLRVENEILIRSGREPEDIAVAGAEEDTELLFVANFASDTVSVVDTLSLEETGSVRVGDGPVAVTADPPLEAFERSRSLSFEEIEQIRDYREHYFNVYVANRNSRDISVLKVRRDSGQVEHVVRIEVEWSPVALAVDPNEGKLYVASYDSDRLSVIDIPDLIRGNASASVATISELGMSSVDVLADPSLDRLYVLKEMPGGIIVARPSSLDPGQQTIPPVVGALEVGGKPRSFILDAEDRIFYIVDSGSNSVFAVNKATGAVEKAIPVGLRPYGITMFPPL